MVEQAAEIFVADTAQTAQILYADPLVCVMLVNIRNSGGQQRLFGVGKIGERVVALQKIEDFI